MEVQVLAVNHLDMVEASANISIQRYPVNYVNFKLEHVCSIDIANPREKQCCANHGT